MGDVMPLADAGPMSLDARRRRTAGLMAAQFDRPVSQDTFAQPMAPGTEVVDRGGLVPLGTYSDGRTGLAWPGFITDPVQSFNRLLTQGYTSGDPQGAEDAFNVSGAAMLGGIAAPRPRGSIGMSGRPEGAAANAAAERPGIRAYHGSPHDFDRFDLSKIGTGEGAQAYGHGLYFAENEAVAQSYKGTGPRAPTSGPNAGQVHYAVKGPDGYDYQFHPLGSKPNTGSPYLTSDKALAERIAQENGGKIRDTSGKMYEVRINASPDDFLDWDKPLSQQSERVRALLDHPNVKRQTEFLGDPNGEKFTGRGAYGAVTGWNTSGSQRGIPDAAALREAGIPGIKYLDQGSRTAGEGSRNYVVFDDKLVEILRKYGLLGMAGGAAAAQGLGIMPQAAPFGALPDYRDVI